MRQLTSSFDGYSLERFEIARCIIITSFPLVAAVLLYSFKFDAFSNCRCALCILLVSEHCDASEDNVFLAIIRSPAIKEVPYYRFNMAHI